MIQGRSHSGDIEGSKTNQILKIGCPGQFDSRGYLDRNKLCWTDFTADITYVK